MLEVQIRARGETVAQLMERSGRSIFESGTLVAATLLEAKIATGKIPAERADELRRQQQDARKALQEREANSSHPDGFHPAASFPSGAEIVVRPSALTEFVTTLEDGSASSKKIDERERTTLLNIIGAQLKLLQDSSRPRLPSQSDVVNALVERFPRVYGIGQRTLEGKFAEANRSLKQ